MRGGEREGGGGRVGFFEKKFPANQVLVKQILQQLVNEKKYPASHSEGKKAVAVQKIKLLLTKKAPPPSKIKWLASQMERSNTRKYIFPPQFSKFPRFGRPEREN